MTPLACPISTIQLSLTWRQLGSLVFSGINVTEGEILETQVRTPQLVFMQPQRLIVPLFQRRYVWNQESQWEPLWSDVTRVAERLLANPTALHQPHFLG